MANVTPDANPGKLCGAPTALRRRRQASYRCEPLASGHRDPWRPWRPARVSRVHAEAAVANRTPPRGAGPDPAVRHTHAARHVVCGSPAGRAAAPAQGDDVNASGV